MNTLLAWIETRGPDEFAAAFVSKATASERPPVIRRCRSPEEAREWVKREAEALGVPVEWTDRSPPLH